MGYDAPCTLRLDGTIAIGRACLEHKDLVFRGSRRLTIPLAGITSATSASGVLRVRFDDREAEFEIGEQAVKWAARITNPPSRLDKLGIKPGLVVALVQVTDEAFVEELQTRGVTILRRLSASRPADIVCFGAQRREALDRLPSLVDRLQPNGAIWVIRPKGQKSITEADTMAAGKRAGLVDVKVVSFSDALSAEKFVIPVANRKPMRKSAGRSGPRSLQQR